LGTEKKQIKILFENENLLVADKPTGLPCHQTLDPKREDLLRLLKVQTGSELFLLHRIDVGTSGLVLLCKNQDYLNQMQELLKNHAIKKTYFALGHTQDLKKNQTQNDKLIHIHQQLITGEEVTFQNHLKMIREKGKDKMVETKSGGQKAISILQRIVNPGDLSRNLLFASFFDSQTKAPKIPSQAITFKVQIVTGRKHQIRSHMATLGFPLLGDQIYYPNSPAFPRLALHSWKVEFTDPVTQKNFSFESV